MQEEGTYKVNSARPAKSWRKRPHALWCAPRSCGVKGILWKNDCFFDAGDCVLSSSPCTSLPQCGGRNPILHIYFATITPTCISSDLSPCIYQSGLLCICVIRDAHTIIKQVASIEASAVHFPGGQKFTTWTEARNEVQRLECTLNDCPCAGISFLSTCTLPILLTYAHILACVHAFVRVYMYLKQKSWQRAF